ncbi:hypothetical protein [Cellulomonas sp. URHE0023]|uniref:hypothetical protein n=1 Tax=Cellulomonas sp. URHE0023 TaxID=1380354 RepID=UPI0005599530|nr:hypothetical protein [Cellulomonas sp. URHE0023]
MIERYDGHILGLATSDGRRVVVGRWLRSPWPPFADVMSEDAAGWRTLLAPTPAVAEEISQTYVFDEVVITPVRLTCDPAAREWRVEAGPFDAVVTLGGRTALGAMLTALPRTIARSRAFATAADPVARAVFPDVRTRGTAGGGRREWYGALGQHRVVAVRATWDSVPCGELTATVPPVRFGFSSVPGRPTVTAVRTTISGGGSSRTVAG